MGEERRKRENKRIESREQGGEETKQRTSVTVDVRLKLSTTRAGVLYRVPS